MWLVRIVIFHLALFGMANLAYAYTGFGICNYGKETLPEVVCYGPAVLKETTVTGDLKVAGPLKAYHVVAGELEVTGTTEMEDSKINGEATVVGAFNVTKTNFDHGLTITGQEILFDHSTVTGDLRVISDNEKPIVELNCNSWVTGSIIFEGVPGTVKITNDSIVKGKLQNGEFEFVNQSCKK